MNPLLLLLCTLSAPNTDLTKINSLKHGLISESSGITTSQRYDNILWTHNDSGNKAQLFAITTDGEHVASVAIRDGANLDWEDICSATIDNVPYLIIGECGDNWHIFPQRSCLFIREPELDSNARNLILQTAVDKRYNYTLEGGPQDCEGITYLAHKHSILFASKEATQCRWFLLKLEEKQSSLVAQHIATCTGIQKITACDIDPSGQYLAAYNFQQHQIALFFHRNDWEQSLSHPHKIIDISEFEPGQIEALCWSHNSEILYLTMEQAAMPLLSLSIDIPLEQ